MTAMAMDVRELSMSEINEVAGGLIWVPVIIGAALILGGCAHTKQVREADGSPGDEGAVPKSN